MKVGRDGMQWGGPDGDWYWFYWWNWLPKKLRYFGHGRDWYDGPIGHFGFWWINWSWSTRWTKPPKEFRSKS